MVAVYIEFYIELINSILNFLFIYKYIIMVKINRKIKIIDVDDNYDDLKLQIQDEAIEPIQEEEILEKKPVLKRQVSVKKVKPVEEKQEPIPEVEPVEEVKPVEEKQEPIPEVEPVELPCGRRHCAEVKEVSCHSAGPTGQNVRVQELVECPDCHKMITPKSFKYSHKKTCSANTPSANKPAEPVKPKDKVKAAAIRPALTSKEPPPEVTPEPQRVTQPVVMKPLTADERRKQALTNLFMTTLKR
jgi:hypothetical protein